MKDLVQEIIRQKAAAFARGYEADRLVVGGIFVDILIEEVSEKLAHSNRPLPTGRISLNGMRLFNLKVETVDGDVFEVR